LPKSNRRIMPMDLTQAYANMPHIPGAADYPPRWAAQAAAFRGALGGRALCDLAYGPAPRQQFDLFLPQAAPVGLIVFVHGGYWVRFHRSDWSHLAAGALAQGWAVAMPSYTLAPEARIGAIGREIAQAVQAAAARVEGPIVLTGHSAGGHLAARMVCVDAPLPAAVAERIVRCVPVSPVAELAPLIETAMNADLRLDAAEADAESPARKQPRAGVSTTVWVGGQERPMFLFQARLLAESWGCPWHVAADRHHFDVIDAYAEPSSALVRTLCNPV
jgi:arylformamidase